MKYSLALVLLSLAPLCAAADCLKDGQDVEFEGSVSRETFPGRPNYASIDDGDEPETVWILTVDTPNCVVGESLEDGKPYEVARSTRRFQLVFADSAAYERYKGLVENRARVRGELFTAHTGHHHTKALIQIKEIAAAKSSSKG